MRMEVVPVGGTGWFTLPLVRVWVGEGEQRVEVPVLDARRENGGKRAVYVRP
jgi:hypothetical protein